MIVLPPSPWARRLPSGDDVLLRGGACEQACPFCREPLVIGPVTRDTARRDKHGINLGLSVHQATCCDGGGVKFDAGNGSYVPEAK